MKSWMKQNGLLIVLMIALIGSFALPAIGEDYERPWVKTQALYIGGTQVTSTAAELNYADVTPGTITASKAIVVDSNLDAAIARNFSVTNLDAGASGTAGTLDVFPATASKGKLSITAADSAGDTITTIVNASQADTRSYTIPDAGGDGYFVMSTTAQNTAGQLDREDLSEDALQPYGIPANTVMAADGEALSISETAGDLFLHVGTNFFQLRGEEANNETEESIGYFQFVLPPEYVAAGSVTIRLRCKLEGAGTDNSSDIDIEVYEQADGAVGSDLCETAAQTFDAKSTYYNKDFVVTATGLVAGDILNVKIIPNVVESASSALAWYSDPPKVLLDIKG